MLSRENIHTRIPKNATSCWLWIMVRLQVGCFLSAFGKLTLTLNATALVRTTEKQP